MKNSLESDITISPLLIVTNFGSVIDAYQPEPGNLVTRDAFWKKWQQILTVMQYSCNFIIPERTFLESSPLAMILRHLY